MVNPESDQTPEPEGILVDEPQEEIAVEGVAEEQPAEEPAAAEDVTTSASAAPRGDGIFLGDSVEGFVRDGCGPHPTPGGWLGCPDCVAYLRGETA